MKLDKAGSFSGQHLFIYKIWLWWRRPFACKLGFHVFNWRERGTSPCSGLMDFYCQRCQKHIKSLPYDDVPEQYRIISIEKMIEDNENEGLDEIVK